MCNDFCIASRLQLAEASIFHFYPKIVKLDTPAKAEHQKMRCKMTILTVGLHYWRQNTGICYSQRPQILCLMEKDYDSSPLLKNTAGKDVRNTADKLLKHFRIVARKIRKFRHCWCY